MKCGLVNLFLPTTAWIIIVTLLYMYFGLKYNKERSERARELLYPMLQSLPLYFSLRHNNGASEMGVIVTLACE